MAEWLVYLTAESQRIGLLLAKILKAKGCGNNLAVIWTLLFFFAAILVVKFCCKFVPKRDWERLFFCWRLQRHDFNNHLQIISAMLQLGKVDNALDYIQTVKKQNELFSAVCSLENPRLISEVLDLIILLKKKGFDIFIKVPDDFDFKKVNLQDIKYLKKKVWEILKDEKDLKEKRNLQIVFPETLSVYDSKLDII
ncbi:MAG: hypothetical protein PWP45_1812 [Tepidanaerobacteraceae bacterium]|nr:hypothetical protein [Tepidanaerobacteraceae bacterium]